VTAAVRGIDVSTWQHPNGAAIDWEEVEGTGITFVLVKVTQGDSYVNPWAARDLEDARAAGLLTGAYHYFDAGVPAGAQALNFMSHAIGSNFDLGVWLDWECYPPEAYTHSQEIAEFMAACREHFASVGVYADEGWTDILAKGSPPITNLWVAAWGTQQPTGALIWQDASAQAVAGVPAPVDTDLLLSTRCVNLLTAPKPKPTAATTTTVRPKDDATETDETGTAPLD
jgi:GH25 family lysozyme M1 (1,4-beta-N-acetylmuramidase)